MLTIPTATLVDVLATRIGCEEEDLREVAAGCEVWTWHDLLALDTDPDGLVWLAYQPELLPESLLKTWAVGITDRALRTHCLHCGIEPVEAWAQKWLSGEDRSVDSARVAVSAGRAAWTKVAAETAKARGGDVPVAWSEAAKGPWGVLALVWSATMAVIIAAQTDMEAICTQAARASLAEARAIEHAAQLAELKRLVDEWDLTEANP